MIRHFGVGVLALVGMGTLGCERREVVVPVAAVAPAQPAASIVFLSVTSDPKTDPQAVDMAMKFAGFALDEGREVVMFFNVKGVNLPTQAFPDDFAFQDDQPIKTQLAGLIERGAQVHVCPVCMKALKVEAGDLMEGARVTTRPSLFEKIGPSTTVFTY